MFRKDLSPRSIPSFAGESIFSFLIMVSSFKLSSHNQKIYRRTADLQTSEKVRARVCTTHPTDTVVLLYLDNLCEISIWSMPQTTSTLIQDWIILVSMTLCFRVHSQDDVNRQIQVLAFVDNFQVTSVQSMSQRISAWRSYVRFNDITHCSWIES